MSEFNKAFKIHCKKHGLSFLFFRKCKECEFEKNNPQLSKKYIDNLIRKY
jgi:hypothetical protein